MKSSKFITFEGGDGTGKSTQIALLADHLRGRGIDCVITREPGGTPNAEMIRKLLVTGESERWDPKSEALLHFAARRSHLKDAVWPALERGDWVISDRFADSTMAYQGLGMRLGREAINALYKFFYVNLNTFSINPQTLARPSAQSRTRRSRGDSDHRW